MATIKISQLPTIIPTNNTQFIVSRDDTSYTVGLNAVIAKIGNYISNSYLQRTAPAAQDQVLAYSAGNWSATSINSLPNYPIKTGKIASFAPAEQHINTNPAAIAFTRKGELIAWGANTVPKYDNNIESIVPSQARRIRFIDANYSDYLYNYPEVTVQKIIYGGGQLMALLSDGTAWISGYGDKIGLGSEFTAAWTYGLRKITFSDGAIIKSIHVGGGEDCRADGFYGAISTTNNLYMWGYNSAGQLGTGDTNAVTVPRKVTDAGIVNNVKTVALGGSDDNPGYGVSIIVTLDGNVWSAGYNEFGQLGLGSTTNSNTFQRASALGGSYITGVSSVGSGYSGLGSTVFLIKTDKTVWASGRNNYNQLADGTTTNSLYFKQVTSLSNITKLLYNGRRSMYMTCIALDTEGAVYTWGYNGTGACGVAGITTVTTPTKINEREATDIYITRHEGSYSGTGFLRDKTLYTSGNQSMGTTNNTDWSLHRPLPVKNVKEVLPFPHGSPWYYHGGWLMLTEQGDVYGVGYASYYILGGSRNAVASNAPHPVKLFIK